MIKIIVYLHDVGEEHGPFEYIPLPSNIGEWCNYYRVDYRLWKSGFLGIDDREMMNVIPKKFWKSCPGKAGTVIFVDPRNVLHHGTVLQHFLFTLLTLLNARNFALNTMIIPSPNPMGNLRLKLQIKPGKFF